jgi:hypothetical protein
MLFFIFDGHHYRGLAVEDLQNVEGVVFPGYLATLYTLNDANAMGRINGKVPRFKTSYFVFQD